MTDKELIWLLYGAICAINEDSKFSEILDLINAHMEENYPSKKMSEGLKPK